MFYHTVNHVYNLYPYARLPTYYLTYIIAIFFIRYTPRMKTIELMDTVYHIPV